MSERDLDADFRRHAPRLHAYLSRAVGPDLAADLTQDVFVTAFRLRDSIPLGEQAFEQWLQRTARAKAYRALRERRLDPVDRAASYPQALRTSDGGPGAEDSVIDRLAARGIIDGLSPTERELWWLACFEDVSRQEIADLLGISYSNVTTRINRLLAKVRALLAADDDARAVEPRAVEPTATRGGGR